MSKELRQRVASNSENTRELETLVIEMSRLVVELTDTVKDLRAEQVQIRELLAAISGEVKPVLDQVTRSPLIRAMGIKRTT